MLDYFIYTHTINFQVFSYLLKNLKLNQLMICDTEATLQRWSYKKVLLKYAANLQENTHVLVWRFAMGVLL